MTPEQFVQIADVFPEPALLVSASGTVLAANRAVQTLGWSAEALRGRALAELTSTAAESLHDYLQRCARGEEVRSALDLIGAEARSVPCDCHATIAGATGDGEEPRLVLRLIAGDSAPS